MDDRRRRFEAQVLPHLDAAYRFARWLARSPEGVDDIVQDAVLRAFRSYDGLRNADAKAWFMTIVRNCHITAQKNSRRRRWVPLPEEHETEDGPVLVATTPDPETMTVRRDEERVLRRLLAQLPGEFREVLVLRELEEMTYSQIASVTKTPLGTVMSRLSRARAALRNYWQQQVDGGERALS